MRSEVWRWGLGVIYIIIVATIWVASSFVVQSVMDDGGVSPFFITCISNSLFLICIPIYEIARYFDDYYTSTGAKSLWFFQPNIKSHTQTQTLITDLEQEDEHQVALLKKRSNTNVGSQLIKAEGSKGLDSKGRWTRIRTAKLSLLLGPFWFFAYFTLNLSLKYTTVTSNTILNSTCSLFAFLISLLLLGEKFAWIKLVSVLLCLGGTIIVSLGDMGRTRLTAFAIKPFLGDILAVVSASLSAGLLCAVRRQVSTDDEMNNRVSMMLVNGFMGLFNLFIFLPIALVLYIAKLDHVSLSWMQFGLVVGKGLLDNVLGNFLLAKAALLTTPTMATAGVTIQVPMAAIVDAVKGHPPHLTDYLGALAIMVGFAGINTQGAEIQNVNTAELDHHLPISGGRASS